MERGQGGGKISRCAIAVLVVLVERFLLYTPTCKNVYCEQLSGGGTGGGNGKWRPGKAGREGEENINLATSIIEKRRMRRRKKTSINFVSCFFFLIKKELVSNNVTEILETAVSYRGDPRNSELAPMTCVAF